MAEANQIAYNYKELAAMMVRAQEIHEGIWGLWVKFGLRAANIGDGIGTDLFPAAVLPVLEIGIQKMDAVSNLSVDAAVVNPAPTKAKAKSKRKVQ